MRYKLEIRATSLEKRDLSFEINTTRYQIVPAPGGDSTVRYLECSRIVLCRSIPYIDKIHQSWLIISNLCSLRIVRSGHCTIQSLAGAGAISKLTIRSPSFAGFCELDWQLQFNCCKADETRLMLRSKQCPFKF
jgi:hypothetical protein